VERQVVEMKLNRSRNLPPSRTRALSLSASQAEETERFQFTASAVRRRGTIRRAALFISLESGVWSRESKARRDLLLLSDSRLQTPDSRLYLVKEIFQMAEITASAVKSLREKTGAGMMECKNALTEANGSEEQAIEILRKRGLASARKKEGRIAAEGAVGSYIHMGGK